MAGLNFGPNVTAHKVRAIATSWAYYNQVGLPDIMAVAFWRPPGVFQNSYLRDLASSANGLYTLGPIIVAAQQVVLPPVSR